MDIVIPKVILTVDFGEYAPAMAGKFLHVWVNPPRDFLREHDEIVFPKPAPTSAATPGEQGKAEEVSMQERAQKLKEFYARMWSQGPVETHWTAEELRVLEEKDPALLTWMIDATWALRREHTSRKKKS